MHRAYCISLMISQKSYSKLRPSSNTNSVINPWRNNGLTTIHVILFKKSKNWHVFTDKVTKSR